MPRYFFLHLLLRDQFVAEENVTLLAFSFALLYAMSNKLPFWSLKIFA
jgi:hypothetical protein